MADGTAEQVGIADPPLRRSSRRTLIAGVGALSATVLVGCATNDDSSGDAAVGEALAKTSDIPEGGGTIFDDAKVVVTQPTAGTFKAFSALCTHQGCLVTKVESGTIDCPCHGSKYTLEGAVAHGPATQPLGELAITVEGGNITLA